MRPADVMLGRVSSSAREIDVGLLLLRVSAGLALALAHGWGKLPPSERLTARVTGMGLPAPEVFAWLAGFAEFGGGLVLALGMLTRPAAFLVLGNMLFVVLLAHAGDTFAQREKAILFGVIALVLLITGPGRYSIDDLLLRRSGKTGA